MKIAGKVMTWDHSRDLLHMVNTFRNEIVQPIIGIGYSRGRSQLYLPFSFASHSSHQKIPNPPLTLTHPRQSHVVTPPPHPLHLTNPPRYNNNSNPRPRHRNPANDLRPPPQKSMENTQRSRILLLQSIQELGSPRPLTIYALLPRAHLSFLSRRTDETHLVPRPRTNLLRPVHAHKTRLSFPRKSRHPLAPIPPPNLRHNPQHLPSHSNLSAAAPPPPPHPPSESTGRRGWAPTPHSKNSDDLEKSKSKSSKKQDISSPMKLQVRQRRWSRCG